MAKYTHLKGKKQLKSILLVFLLVAMSLVVVFPLTAPEVRAAVTHLASAALEDAAGLPYDIGPAGDGEVIWDPNEGHSVSHLDGYLIEAGMTLDIPSSITITFQGFSSRSMDVYGTLITNFGSLMPPTYATFTGPSGEGWQGITFHSGSQGRIVSTIIKDALYGVVFEPGSTLMNPGIKFSTFENCGPYGLRMDGVSGFTSISDVTFDDGSDYTTISLDVANGDLDMKNVLFYSHARGDPGLHITNASVYAEECWFNGLDEPGNMVIIEGSSNGTIFNRCAFLGGLAGEYYIRVDGSSISLTDCRFKTSDGARTVIANDDASGIPAHPVLLNPTDEGTPGDWTDTFDNSTMNATGNSSVTLKWYMDVFVKDPNGDPIDNAPVWVKDRNGDPADPSFKITDVSGWARGFIVTELIKYNDSVTNFNPFNVSAEAFSMKGYADPEPIMNMSKEVSVTVPFNPNNVPPIVSWLPTPFGVQSDYITIDFMLEDPNPGDDGNLSIIVEYSTDGTSWYPAISGPGSDLDHLYNNTLYQFVWDSSQNLGNTYSTTVSIRITPRDRVGNGTPSQTGNFTVDNKPPIVSWLPTPVGVQSGFITIDFMLEDPSPGDDGNLSIIVEYSTDGISWYPAISGPGSDLDHLYNNTLYQFVWDSSQNLGNTYSTTVSIRITPRDRVGNGTPSQTGNFTVDNKPPIVSLITTPVGVQSGLITIQYKVVGFNVGDNGDMGVEVFFSTDPINEGWRPATQAGGNPTTGLYNDTLYTFIWDSTADKNLPGEYNTTVYIQIIPYNKGGNGPPNQTDNFTVDNKVPVFLSGPTVTPANTTALIEWTVDEPAHASVWYGIDDTITDMTTGSSGATLQSVTLTNLQPGRSYTYYIVSEDPYGNEFSSFPTTYEFITEVHIQLYEGWNMISVPPEIPDIDLATVLAPIAGDWDTIWTYYIWELEDPWKLNDTNNPTGSDLHDIIPDSGYWIHMINDAVLILDHDVPTGPPPPGIPLFEGWNFIGYPSVTTRSIDDALSGVQYDVIETYDAATDQWLSYDGSTGDLTQMEMGRGYWIYVTEFTLWSVEYAE